MKKILSLLMCYVFLQAETFALKGGPGNKGGGGALSGLYAGIFTADPNDPKNDLARHGSDLGMFQIQVPQTGPSIGTIVIFDFQNGEIFLGLVNGVSDPDTQTLTGVFKGIARLGDEILQDDKGNVTIVEIVQLLSGQLSLKSAQSTKKNAFTQRLVGKGVSTVSSGFFGVPPEYVGWVFDGFQQTANPTSTPTPFTVGATLDPPTPPAGTPGT